MTEVELVERAQSGDRAEREVAFAELVRRVRPKLLATCANMLGNAHDAADVVQNTLLLAHRALPGFKGEARFSTWVFRIAVREALSFRARHGRAPVDAEVRTLQPEAQLEAREALRQTQAALSQLKAEHRTVLSLFAVEGLGHAEIAEILGIPEGTIWRRLHEARKQLAARLTA